MTEKKNKQFLLNCSKLFSEEKKVSEVVLEKNKALKLILEKLEKQIGSIK